MSLFSDPSSNEEVRRDEAFNHIIALREGLSIARRQSQPTTYKTALAILNDIDSDAYEGVRNLITKTNPSEMVRYYMTKAEAINREISQRDGEITKVTAPELIKKDLEDERPILQHANNKRYIQTRIMQLEAALEYFEPEDISENQILNHDFSIARHDFFGKKIYDTAKEKDYELSDNRALRIRLLHPDKAESILGSDLVYEQFDLTTKMVKFIHLQYKTWNTKSLNLNQGSIRQQLFRMQQNLCASGYCVDEKGNLNSGDYRFPHCCAFLRPTSKLTKPDAALVSTGLHVPICQVIDVAKTQTSLNNENLKGKNIGHNLFYQLFIENFIGSRWIHMDQLETFYKERGITSNVNILRVHAQEVVGLKDDASQPSAE